MNHHERHIDDEAELYALGMLDEHESARVNAHVRACDPCAERLGRAEATVAAMVDATLPSAASIPVPLIPQARRLVRWPQLRFGFGLPAWGAAAATLALAVSTGVLADQNLAMRGALRSDGNAMLAMVQSHFVHAQFASPSGTPIEAKVIYERHGRWYEVLARGADPSWRLEMVRGNGQPVQLSQGFARRGEIGMLRIAGAGRIEELQLRDGSGKLMGSVRPVVAGAAEAAGPIRGSGVVSLNR
jgi:hypothetical protein